MIDISNLSVQFAGKYLFKDVNLKIHSDDKIALVGSNGTGKSTFLKILAKKEIPETGVLNYRKYLSLGYLPQEIVRLENNSIFFEVRNSIPEIDKIDQEEKELTKLLQNSLLSQDKKEKIIYRLGKITHIKEEIGYYEIDSKIKKVLSGLGFLEKDFQNNTSSLSGGWLMRVELAKILVTAKDLILLDEPTNHLDIDSLQWLIKFLKNFKGAIILVSHDRFFVNEICSKTLEIYNNELNFFKGSYDKYLDFKVQREEQLKLEYLNQQKQIKKTEDFIERFRYKATKAKQVQSRIKQLEKIEKIELISSENKINFRLIEAIPSGAIPIKVDNVCKSYGNLSVLENINISIERGNKIALVGPNGAGKTTLAKIVSKRILPTSGKIEFGYNTLLSFYAQDVIDNLKLENEILSELEQSTSDYTTLQLRSILGAFLFHGDDVYKKISVLSGGEKSRVALAKVLLSKANTIVLDEPTNHLDFDSKKILQEALIKFPGTLIIVSHDIDFLKPIVGKVFEVRGKNIKEYFGGIEYYLSKKEEELSKEDDIILSDNSVENISRKDKKRIEAERRQNYYNSTKDLKVQIQKLEKIIETLEQSKSNLELELTFPEVYTNPIIAKQKKNEYDKIITELNEQFHKWTLLTEELEKIDKLFDINN